MKLLVDAHTAIWAVDQPCRLSSAASAALQNPNNELLLSAGSVWEIAIKTGQGKLKLTLPFKPWMDKAIADLGLAILPVTVEYADLQANLPNHHRDPFDRLLVAQAIIEQVPVVSADPILDRYGVIRIW